MARAIQSRLRHFETRDWAQRHSAQNFSLGMATLQKKGKDRTRGPSPAAKQPAFQNGLVARYLGRTCRPSPRQIEFDRYLVPGAWGDFKPVVVLPPHSMEL